MNITRHIVAKQIHSYLKHQLSLKELVHWSEEAMMTGTFDENDASIISEVVARLGVADAENFGLLWQEWDELLLKLGYRLDFDLKEVA
ncbi:MAG: hypothetical protein EP314_02400 [Bacteroidetes bacterium]|nr:MAG: hypothetical protein EP314_02400 [Bacteroidota bacterium]